MSTNAGLSRRSFIGGAGAAMLAVGAGSMLAGCGGTPTTVSAEDAAAKDAEAAPASSGSDWLGEAPEVTESDIVETKETDILIVGAGMSGIIAAASASELGANFMVVEKGTEPAAPHFDFGACNSRYQIERGLTFDTSRWMNEMMRYASFKADQSVLRTWVENSGATIDWIADVYAEHFGQETVVEVDVENGGEGNAGGTVYFMPPECHHISNPGMADERGRTDHVKAMTQIITDNGGEVSYGYDLVKLIREEGAAVTGAIFNTENGYVQINAAKGVILATGGYPANKEMLEARNPIVPACVTSLNYNQNNTGMGIKAAMWAGAAIDQTPSAMIFDRGVVAPGVDAGYDANGQFATGGQFNLGSQPFLKLDRNGRRICNESANYDAICHAAASRPGGVWCQVFDVNAPEDVQRFQTQGCSAMTWKMQLKDKTVDEAYEEKYLSKGLMMKADTLDELADKLGFEGEAKAAFLAEIDNYNAMYDAGEDTQFGKEAYRLSAIREAPFYGAWYGGSLLTTIDGLRINAHTQVLDTEGKVIEGLHAVGTCSGSYYSGNYPVYIVGNCLGRQATFGRYAARFLAGDIQA